MNEINKPPRLMTRNELDYAYFKMTGIKPVPYNAPKKEHEAFHEVLKIRIGLMKKEQEKRQAARGE